VGTLPFTFRITKWDDLIVDVHQKTTTVDHPDSVYPPTECQANTVGSHGVCSNAGCQSGNPLVTPNRHSNKNFSDGLVELAKFVSFGMAWVLAVRILLWPVSLARISPLLFLCGMALGLFSLVVFNRWRLCRELRELAWQQWIDSVSPIARQYGLELGVIRLSDRWRNYFERGMSPESAVSQYKSDCMAGRFDHELS
jgi:hypothetical protein